MPWTTSYYHADALGSTRALTDDGEVVTDRYVYDAFGNQRQATGSTVNPFRYVGLVGYYYDQDSENYYVRARYYNPRIIRWLTPDQLRFLLLQMPSRLLSAGSNSRFDWNLYRYAGDNPTNVIDPTGELGHIAGGALVGCAGGASYSIVVSLFSGDSYCHTCCKAIISCLFGALGGGDRGSRTNIRRMYCRPCHRDSNHLHKTDLQFVL